MIVGDNQGHALLKDICDAIWPLPDEEGDIWIFVEGAKEPSLKFELKTLSDFWNRHIGNDTLNPQLEKVDGLILLGEEDFAFDFVVLQTIINGIQDHTRVYRVKDANMLRDFVRTREKKLLEGTFGVLEIRRKSVKEFESMVHALTNIEKVSYKIAQRIYDEFDSLGDLLQEAEAVKSGTVNVKKSRFCQIDKVGPILAMKIIDWVLQEWTNKSTPSGGAEVASEPKDANQGA